jgi:hypothetical protein
VASWGEFAAAQPEFAKRVRARFTARKHYTLATLRQDGAPRISGTEVSFQGGQRDAKLAGRAIESTDPNRVHEGHRFRVEITEVVLTRVGEPADHLVIESWHPERGLQRRERR